MLLRQESRTKLASWQQKPQRQRGLERRRLWRSLADALLVVLFCFLGGLIGGASQGSDRVVDTWL